MNPLVVGIDPGGKNTGLVVRRGQELIGHEVVTSDTPAIGLPSMDYMRAVAAAFYRLVHDRFVDVYALEDVTPPRGFKNGRRDAIQPGSLIGVSAMAGFFLSTIPGVVLIPPARNGSRPLTSYPPQLVGPREKTGGGILRHARSAWDVAGAASNNHRRTHKESREDHEVPEHHSHAW